MSPCRARRQPTLRAASGAPVPARRAWRACGRGSPVVTPERAVRAQHVMAGNEPGDGIRAHRGTDRTRRARDCPPHAPARRRWSGAAAPSSSSARHTFSWKFVPAHRTGAAAPVHPHRPRSAAPAAARAASSLTRRAPDHRCARAASAPALPPASTKLRCAIPRGVEAISAQPNGVSARPALRATPAPRVRSSPGRQRLHRDHQVVQSPRA